MTTMKHRGVALPDPILTPAQARAATSVRREITRAMDDGETVPCIADPAGWDADHPPSKALRVELERVVRLCLTSCPAAVLRPCRAFLATDPPVGGVCAGTYRPHQGEKKHGEIKREWAAQVAAALTDEAGRAAA
jgi:hypothetical protein